MRSLFAFAIIALGLFLSGCDDDISVTASNEAVLRGSGERVGILRDGREIVRYRIQKQGDYDHWVYVVNGSVTVNKAETHGKTHANHVAVLIDGVTYVPAP